MQINEEATESPKSTWTEDEITRLIDWGLLHFLPHDYLPEPGLDSAEKERLLKKMQSHFTPMQLTDMESESRQLRKLDVGWRELDGQANMVAARVLSFESDESDFELAHQYVRVHMGLKPSLLDAKSEITKRNDPHSLLCLSLIEKDQLNCLLEWTEVGTSLWISYPWGECMKLRYGPDAKSPMKLLSRSVRKWLDTEATRLKNRDNPDSISAQKLMATATPDRNQRRRLTVNQIVREEYLQANLSGQLSRSHALYGQIAKSGVFERVAERAALQARLRKETRSSFEREFLRYPCAADGHPDAVVGRILYELLMTRDQSWLDRSTEQPVIKGLVAPPMHHPFPPVPDTVRRVGNLVAKALGIDPHFIDFIWHGYLDLYRTRLWEKLTGKGLWVFRATKLLKERDAWV